MGAAGERGTATVRPVFRTGAMARVHKLSGGNGPGLWITDTTARALRLRVGDQIAIRGTAKRAYRAPVAAIFRDPARGPLPEFWSTFVSFFRPITERQPQPPPIVLGDRSTIQDLEARVRDQADFRWELPLAGGDLPFPAGKRLASGLLGMENDLVNPTTDLGFYFRGPEPPDPASRAS